MRSLSVPVQEIIYLAERVLYGRAVPGARSGCFVASKWFGSAGAVRAISYGAHPFSRVLSTVLNFILISYRSSVPGYLGTLGGRCWRAFVLRIVQAEC